jgi:integrase/recombinase XerD
MTALERALSDYLTLRWRLGYKLGRPGQLLAQFVAHLDDVGADTVTIARAVDWATQPTGADPNWWAYRLDAVRGFAAYLHTLDPAVPELPRDLLPYRSRRAMPYLYSDDELAALIDAADNLPHPLRADTYRTMIALLAVTGLRIGEAIRLDVDDLDPQRGVLVVREGKFAKTRQLPLHASTVAALADYLRRRERLCPRPRTPALFLSGRGSRVCHCNISSSFHELTRVAGLAPRSARCRPRLHDLRHTFAVRTVLDWYRAGVDVQERMPLLSTYLGHVSPAATYWYLSAAPELLALAGQRLEQHLEDRS